MNTTTIPNSPETSSVLAGRYITPQPLQCSPPPAASNQVVAEVAQVYMKAHRAADNSVVIVYSSSEAHARSVRRQISRLLND